MGLCPGAYSPKPCLKLVVLSFVHHNVRLMYSRNLCSAFVCLHALIEHAPYLCNQNICHSVDSVVSVAGRDKTFSLPFFETGQEMCVKLKEVFQTGEQTLQPS